MKEFQIMHFYKEFIYKHLPRGGTVICCIASTVSHWIPIRNKLLVFITEKTNKFAAALAGAVDIKYAFEFHGNKESALVVEGNQGSSDLVL